MTDKEAKELAEEHWAWVETWLHMVYVDAFIHGWGHGAERAGKEKAQEAK